MSKDGSRRLGMYRLEIDMSYPFPSIVGLLSLFIIAASVSLQSLPDYGMEISLPIGWDTTVLPQELAAVIRIMTTRSATFSILNSFYILLFLVPLLIAFNLSLGFGNGQIRTLVSYPVGRMKLLLAKSGVVFILTTTAVTLGGIMSLVFFYPFTIDLVVLAQLLIPLWITVFLMTTSCVFIAVLSRSAPLTAVAGIGVWVGAFVMIPSQSLPSYVVYVIYPLLAAINCVAEDTGPIHYLWTTSVNDVLLGCGAALVLSVLLLCLSALAFRRMEV